MDNVGAKFTAETAELGEPLVVSADGKKVRGASFISALGHGLQPSRNILLSDALRQRCQVLRIDPAVVVLEDRNTVRIEWFVRERKCFCNQFISIVLRNGSARVPRAATLIKPAVQSIRHVIAVFIASVVSKLQDLEW